MTNDTMTDDEGLDFEIDKLTNSIENVSTSETFKTDVSRLSAAELKTVNKKTGWLFNWKIDMKCPEREVYKLTIAGDNIIQGLISIEDNHDHIYMHLIESAPFNRGKTKIYAGVPGNMVAFACNISLQKGYDGYVAFLSKTKLIEHYQQTLGAILLGGGRMYIKDTAAHKLIDRYFKD
jgi:hypothetical protein